MSWKELLYLCDLNRIIWSLTWLPQYKAGGKNGSISRTRRPLTRYGLAPFDANKSLTKLTTWDSPPLEAEVEDIKPLLAHIQRLKSTAGVD
jgi:hypothetical protein